MYDDRGRLIRHVSFEGTVKTTSYDPGTGRVASEEYFDNLTDYDDGEGTPIETRAYQFDVFGRQIAIETTNAAGTTERTWRYDSQGRLKVAVSPEGTIRYDYDVYGRLIRTYTGADGEAPENDTRYTYTSLGQLDTVTVYERNDVPLASNAREVTDYDYDIQGNLSKVVKPNGVIDAYQYNAMNRLTSLTNYAPDGTPNDLTNNTKISNYEYDYRSDGKKESETDTDWNEGTPEVSSYAWTYDENGRLTDEVFTSFDELLSQSEHFSFDLAGNRLTQEVDKGNDETIDESTAYEYDENDRLETETTGDTVTMYGYDHTKQVSKAVEDDSVIQQSLTYGWDVAGRMNSVTVESYTSGTISKREKLTYDFDNDSIRVSVLTERDATADGTFETRQKTMYLVDAQNITGYQENIVETTVNADTDEVISTTNYTYGPQLISQTVFNSENPNGLTSCFGLDGHGSTRLLLSMAAAVQQAFTYDAYGNAIGFVPAMAMTDRLYNAESFNAITGLQYLRARSMQLNTGTFLGLDPYAGDPMRPLSFNKYLYAGADGINKNDPTGQFENLIGTMIASTVVSHLVSTVAFAAMPLLNSWASKLVPGSIWDAITNKLTYSAAIFSGGMTWEGNVSTSIPLSVGAAFNFDLLVSPNTKEAANYFALGGILSLKNPSSGINGYGAFGFAYRTPDSSKYTQHFINITFSYKAFNPIVQAKMQSNLLLMPTVLFSNTIALMQLTQWTYIEKAFQWIQSSWPGLVNKIMSFSGSVFFDPTNIKGGSVGVGLSVLSQQIAAIPYSQKKFIGAPTVYIGYSYYWQLGGNPNTPFE